ncbi:MAG: nucleotidyltransferase domain-containing protein [Chloroflexota bacterium]|nr:nucleotidyltransferase domain-containing protein [Chloroflexota bacterium]
MPTALELTPEERMRYVRAARRQPPPPELTADQRAEREALLARARAAARELKQRCGAKRVLLFGSLAHAAWFTPGSDVDLAVEGLADGTFWEAWRLAETVVADRRVDLVELESVGDSLRAAIARHGVEL